MLCPTRSSLIWQIFAGQRWALSVLEAQTQFDSEAPVGQFMSLTQRSVVVIPPTEGLRLSGVLDSNKISDGQKKKKLYCWACLWYNPHRLTPVRIVSQACSAVYIFIFFDLWYNPHRLTPVRIVSQACSAVYIYFFFFFFDRLNFFLNLKSEQWSMHARTHTHTHTHTHTQRIYYIINIFCTKLSNDVMVLIRWKNVCKLQPRWHWQ